MLELPFLAFKCLRLTYDASILNISKAHTLLVRILDENLEIYQE